MVAGRVLLGPDRLLNQAWAELAASWLRRSRRCRDRRILGFVACGAIARRTAFLVVGGFHPRLGLEAEEQLLAVDLAASGWQLVYRHDVVA